MRYYLSAVLPQDCFESDDFAEVKRRFDAMYFWKEHNNSKRCGAAVLYDRDYDYGPNPPTYRDGRKVWKILGTNFN